MFKALSNLGKVGLASGAAVVAVANGQKLQSVFNDSIARHPPNIRESISTGEDSYIVLEASSPDKNESFDDEIASCGTETAKDSLGGEKRSSTVTKKSKSSISEEEIDGKLLSVESVQNGGVELSDGLESTIALFTNRLKLRDHLLSSDMPAEEKGRAWEEILLGVRDVLSKPEVLEEMIRAARHFKVEDIPEDLLSLTSDCGTDATMSELNSLPDSEQSSAKDFLPISQHVQWENLACDYSCLICRELLAAPVITNCTHSFCGSCLSDHIGSISSADVDVVHSCPACRNPIHLTTYERVLDDSIAKKASLLNGGSSSTRWQARRKQYLDGLKKPNNFCKSVDDAIRRAIPVVSMLVILILALFKVATNRR